MTRIYFLRCADPDLIKIGFSHDPAARCLTIAAATGLDLTLLSTAPGGLKLEAELHGLFAHLHVPLVLPGLPYSRRCNHGGAREWFRPEADLLAYIEAVRAAGEAQLPALPPQRFTIKAPRLGTKARPVYDMWLQYRRGISLQQIADEARFSRGTISALLKQHGYPYNAHTRGLQLRAERAAASRAEASRLLA